MTEGQTVPGYDSVTEEQAVDAVRTAEDLRFFVGQFGDVEEARRLADRLAELATSIRTALS